MSAGSVSADTKLIAVSAIYLHAHWRDPFSQALTGPGPFRLQDGHRVSTTMMRMAQASRLPFVRTADYQALELPYRRSSLAMLAVLPAAGEFTSALDDLNAQSFAQLQKSLRPQGEVVEMPKVAISLQTDLAPELAALGMPLAFTTNADFSGITSTTPLRIDAVEHAAVMRVDENVTTAAAATGGSVQATAAPLAAAPTILFNRPYYLFLVDRATGTALFAASVQDPR